MVLCVFKAWKWGEGLANADACVNFARKRPHFADVGEGVKMAKFCGCPIGHVLSVVGKIGGKDAILSTHIFKSQFLRIVFWAKNSDFG